MGEARQQKCKRMITNAEAEWGSRIAGGGRETQIRVGGTEG
jgi:hypothetical protein